jgi:uncharacterized protein YcfJ
MKIIILAVASAISFQVNSQETAAVISTVQVIQSVAVPRQICTQDTVSVQASKSGAGAAMGAIAGGVIGNQIGQGSGRVAATALGIFGGAILGDKIESAPTQQLQSVQSCRTETSYENRIVGYNVTYEYAGKRYMVQMPKEPGSTILVNVTPVIR